jgi:hypothetical protein
VFGNLLLVTKEGLAVCWQWGVSANSKVILTKGITSLFGLAYYQGKKDIVFRFIIEYSSLRDFYRPILGNK